MVCHHGKGWHWIRVWNLKYPLINEVERKRAHILWEGLAFMAGVELKDSDET